MCFIQILFPFPRGREHINQLAFDRLERPKENALAPAAVPTAIEAKVASDVRRHWDNYHAAMYQLINKKAVAEKLSACYGRLHEKAIKIAMLLAVSDWTKMSKGNSLVIQSAHWAKAQEITEGYRASLHRIVDDASLPIESEDDELAAKIISRIRTGNRNSSRELAQDLHCSSGLNRQRLDTIINQLVRDGYLMEQRFTWRFGNLARGG